MFSIFFCNNKFYKINFHKKRKEKIYFQQYKFHDNKIKINIKINIKIKIKIKIKK